MGTAPLIASPIIALYYVPISPEGSGVTLARTYMAVLETYQREGRLDRNPRSPATLYGWVKSNREKVTHLFLLAAR